MIDELIHHCIEQIGLDGEAGTDIGRFAHYVGQFHSQLSSLSQSPDQLIDDLYLAFVFRQVLSHPHVRVGLFVAGVPLKTGTKSGIHQRKSSALESPAGTSQSTKSDPELTREYDSVNLLPDQTIAEQHGLAKLQLLHGDRLRLVLHTDLIKRLLIGSDAFCLPPSAYRVLQIVCRSREKPVLSTDIGTALHTDQKTVFYICKRLIDLDLIIKFHARETGTVSSYFVATRFQDRCDILVQQKNADVAADLQVVGVASQDTAHPSLSNPSSIPSIQAETADDDGEGEGEDDDDNVQALPAPVVTVKEEESQGLDDAGATGHTLAQVSTPTFEHVDAAKSLIWMSSRPELVRLRIYLVCNSTSFKVTARHRLQRRINLSSIRLQRRAFTSLLQHAVVHGFLEVVDVYVASTHRTYRGLRMTQKGQDEMYELLNGEYGDASSLQQQAKATRLNAKLQQDLSRCEPSLPRELTLERHVHEQVARAGSAGRTISQLMTQLHGNGQFGRVLDQIVQRAEDADGEPSLSDIRIRCFYEHKLRVRNTKLYSHHAWVLQSANDGFLDPADVHLLALAGGPSTLHRKSAFWTAPDLVGQHLASLSKDLFTPTPSKDAPRRGRPPKKRPLDDDRSETPPRKRGRPRIHPLPDSETQIVPKKRGRPRKDQSAPAEAIPTDTEALLSPVSSSFHPDQPTQLHDVVEVDSSPKEVSSHCNAKARPDEVMDDAYTPTVSDSPTGTVKRRSRRLMQSHAQTRLTSLLASTPATAATDEPKTSEAERVAVFESPAATRPAKPSPEAHAAPEITMPSVQDQEHATALEPPLVDVSRLDDLMSASSQVKSEAQPALLATPVAKNLRETTVTPSASERKRRTNVSQLRSSHALVQCIREAGGAVDTLEIADLLTSFVERHGFASDTQLIDLRDRKVREKALAASVNNNLLRRTFVRLVLPTAMCSRRQIIYLPELPPDQLQTYCEAVRQGRRGWFSTKDARTALTHPTNTVAVSTDDASRFAKLWHVRDPFPLANLPKDDQQLSLLRQPFRDVTSVYRQHFGFVSGELVRLKAFHHACAKFVALRSQASTSNHADGLLPLSFFWTEAPLDLFLALVPTPIMDESVEETVLDPQVQVTPICDLPEQLKASLGLTHRTLEEAGISIFSLATQLSQFGLVKLRAVSAPEDQSQNKLNPATATVEPVHRLPLYDWASKEELKPLIGCVDAGLNPDQINRFWAKVQLNCLYADGGRDKHGSRTEGNAAWAEELEADTLAEMEPYKMIPQELSNVLFSTKAWRPFYQLRPSQVKFLYRIALQDIATMTQVEIDRLAYVTLAPQQVIVALLRKRLERSNEPEDPDAPPARCQKSRFTWPFKLRTIELPTRLFKSMEAHAGARTAATVGKPKRTQAQREWEGRKTTLNKARQLRERREQDFQAMLEHAFDGAPAARDLRSKIETALGVIRRKYVAGEVKFDATAAQSAIARAIRSASGLRLMPAVRAPPRDRTKRQERRLSSEEAQDSEVETGGRAQEANGDGAIVAEKPRTKRDRRSRRNADANIFWTPARKELLRDAAVILRVRDEVRGRSDWSALFQIIDREEQQQTRGVIMAQWRNQYYRMRSLDGEEAYLAALESRWIRVYVSARESGILKDDGFPAATGFDLAAQIRILRERIDKNEVQESLAKPIARYHLPLQLNAATDFTLAWKEEFTHEPFERRFEAFFASGEASVTTKRRETLLYTPFGDVGAVRGRDGYTNAEDMVAEWAVRIVIASNDAGEGQQTDMSAADETVKTEFCRGVGDDRIERAMQRLIDLRLIRPISTDPMVRRKPGTNFVFTDELLKLLPDTNAANRLAAADLRAMLKHRMEAFRQIYDVPEGVVLEPVEADGEAAALLPLLQSGLMDGELDTRAFEALRQSVALNARVLNDDDLEALITVKGRSGMIEMLEAAVMRLPAVPADGALDWLAEVGGRDETLEDLWRDRFEQFVQTISIRDARSAQRLREFGSRLTRSGIQGLVLDEGEGTQLSYSHIHTLTTGRLPLGFLMPGTSRRVLVASMFVGSYALAVPSGTSASARLVLPHIWTTLTDASTPKWRALLDSLVSTTLQRPGISMASLTSMFTSPVQTSVVAVPFADLWSAILCLVHHKLVHLNTHPANINMYTLHPAHRIVCARFE